MDFNRILESVKMQKISFEQFRINLFAVLFENVCSSVSIILICMGPEFQYAHLWS